MVRSRHDLALSLAGRASADRAALERLVRQVYHAAYGARVEHMHDRLLGLRRGDDEALAVIGTTAACDHERLFVEHYLDEPVERVASRTLGRPITRRALAEVGNLAAREPGAGLWALSVLAFALRAEGREFVVCAATTTLRERFRRLGVQPLDVAPADGARLGADRERWGRYYDTAPRVVLLDIDAVCRAAMARPALARRLGALWARFEPVPGWRHSA